MSKAFQSELSEVPGAMTHPLFSSSRQEKRNNEKNRKRNVVVENNYQLDMQKLPVRGKCFGALRRNVVFYYFPSRESFRKHTPRFATVYLQILHLRYHRYLTTASFNIIFVINCLLRESGAISIMLWISG